MNFWPGMDERRAKAVKEYKESIDEACARLAEPVPLPWELEVAWLSWLDAWETL